MPLQGRWGWGPGGQAQVGPGLCETVNGDKPRVSLSSFSVKTPVFRSTFLKAGAQVSVSCI